MLSSCGHSTVGHQIGKIAVDILKIDNGARDLKWLTIGLCFCSYYAARRVNLHLMAACSCISFAMPIKECNCLFNSYVERSMTIRNEVLWCTWRSPEIFQVA